MHHANLKRPNGDCAGVDSLSERSERANPSRRAIVGKARALLRRIGVGSADADSVAIEASDKSPAARHWFLGLRALGIAVEIG